MATAVKEPVKASAVIEALEVRYARPEWHVERELTLEGRRLDFVAFNLWGARSYRTVGFEVKVSRADFLRELADFRKTETWSHVVDQFFIVAPGKLLDPSELPAGWGLLELRGSKLFTKQQAAIGERATLPRELAARMLDRLYKRVDQAAGRFAAEKHGLREEIRAEVRQKLAEEAERNGDAIRAKAERFDALLREFGLDHDWKPEVKLVEAMRFLAREDLLNRMRYLVGHLDGRLEQHKKDLEVFTQARDLIDALRNA